ncbi:MAG TPA: DNA translocase FtsK 4TM domain-containing protein [Syntrophales bacterium]|nr:DNA translocase FtsK 4TM domain-containing protein [Syntrophales bacterium]
MKLDERKVKEIYGAIFLAGAIFFLLCLASYHPLDPSFTHFVTNNVKTHNLIGSVGSHTADSLIRLLGIGALIIPLFLLIVSFRYFMNEPFKMTPVGIGGFAGLMLATSSLFAAAIADIQVYGVKLSAGGLLGTWSAEFLCEYLNQAGTYILLLLLLVISLIIVIDFSIVSTSRKFSNAAALLWTGAKGFATRQMETLKERRETAARIIKIEKPAPVIAAPPPPPVEKVKRKKAEQTHFDFIKKDGDYKLPPLSLLDEVERKDTRIKRESLIANSRILEKKLADFGVEGKVVEVKPGPVITMYELEPAPGVKITKVTNLSDDLALALRAPSIRIIAPIPGKAVIGIEIPNHEREPVHLKDVLDNDAFLESQFKLPIALGEDIIGTPVITDLARMPHLLIAGTTGSGKSVSLNAMICSILFKTSPDDTKFLMIDPKRLELSAYEGIAHLLHPVVVDPKRASQVLKWAVEEMERRYQTIVELGVKNIEAYNKLAEKKRKDKTAEPRPASDKGESASTTAVAVKLPYIVIVIDELADLMMVAQRNVEESLARLAQMARAAGIHLILATQRPSVDVITGVIKANFPTRISFQVSSKVDSRTILDQLGAENLLGSGDMLFMPPGTSKLTRIHGPFVSEKEIERIVDFIRKQARPLYDETIVQYQEDSPEGDKQEGEFDEKYDEAVELVTELGQASISLVQRYLKVGYNRAARMIERMEAEGVVGPSDGVKPRKVLARKLSR